MNIWYNFPLPTFMPVLIEFPDLDVKDRKK